MPFSFPITRCQGLAQLYRLPEDIHVTRRLAPGHFLFAQDQTPGEALETWAYLEAVLLLADPEGDACPLAHKARQHGLNN